MSRNGFILYWATINISRDYVREHKVHSEGNEEDLKLKQAVYMVTTVLGSFNCRC